MLFQFPNLLKVVVAKRPSAVIKSPYMSDVIVDGREELAHTPSLSCCGLVAAGREVWVEERSPNDKSKAQSKYTVQLANSFDSNCQVGVNPTLGNRIAYALLCSKLIPFDFDYTEADIHKEVTYGGSRFDLEVRTDGKHIIEVKYVPIAMHEDIDAKEYNHGDYKLRNPGDKLALFPVGEKGIKALKGEAVSPRAVKHLEEMATLLRKKMVSSATLLFVVTRNDITKFKISENDQQYLAAARKALKAGVAVRAVAVEWREGGAYFSR